MAGLKFDFDMAKMAERTHGIDRKVQRYTYTGMKYWSGRVESWIKHNAPWTDRTSNARNGLFATAVQEQTKFFIILGHRVDYGIFLEEGTEKMRARPIIVPAIDRFQDKVFRGIAIKLLDKM